MNSIFNAMNMNNLIGQYQNFRKTFSGDPQQTIQKMLSNGQITQSQVDQARSMMTQFQSLLKTK